MWDKYDDFDCVDYDDLEYMLLLDHADEAYEHGLDINDFSSYEELQDALDDLSDNDEYASGYGAYYAGSSSISQNDSSVSTEPAAGSTYTRHAFPTPEPPSIGIVFIIYLMFMTFLILGSLSGLIFYGRAESWWDWAVEILCIIFLYIIPIWLKVSWYREDLEEYNEKIRRAQDNQDNKEEVKAKQE